MTNRSNALALAIALGDSEDEQTLGPSDAALCVEALRFYARKKRRGPEMLPAFGMGVAAMIVVGGLLTHTDDIRKVANSTAHQFIATTRYQHYISAPPFENVASEDIWGIVPMPPMPKFNDRTLATADAKG